MDFFKKGHRVVGVDISKEMLQKAIKYPFEVKNFEQDFKEGFEKDPDLRGALNNKVLDMLNAIEYSFQIKLFEEDCQTSSKISG